MGTRTIERTERAGRRTPVGFCGAAMVAMVGAVLGALLVSVPSGAVHASTSDSASRPYVSGFISTHETKSATYPQPYLFDQRGRVVLLHGVNAVYKRPPFELYSAPGKPWNFTARDAASIASLGFNVVRLGILWQGIEPGTGGPNNPAICSPGPPRDPGEWNPQIADAYLNRVAQTVALLGKYHVYTLLDMHQDVYNQRFRGEGAPDWAVCTNGNPLHVLPGRWSNNYSSPALDAAFRNFFNNDVVGDLQGEYDRAWAAVASRFANDPWVVGYDPINEPFTTALSPTPDEAVDTDLECFYTGLARPGMVNGRLEVCPPDDPRVGLVPTLLSVDPHHLIFREPTIYGLHGLPNFVGSMPFPNLVLNFHDYCSFRSGITGNPYNLPACTDQEDATLFSRVGEKASVPSSYQQRGLPLFMSEFGATQSASLLDDITQAANAAQIGWIYWSWKYYRDPTGSSAEAAVSPSGRLQPAAKALSQPYPQAIAGVPGLISYNPKADSFLFTYRADPTISAPTLVFVPRRLHYPRGYCATASGGTVTSAPGASVVQVRNPPVAQSVTVTIRPGACE